MKSRIIAAVLLCASFAVASPALAGPQFLAYEGKNAIHEGQGGEKKVVDGVEFWESGDPPHKFQVLGSISDRRFESGIYGMIRMSGLDKDIAKAVHEAGGDAVILANESDDIVGIGSFGSANVYGGYRSAFGFSSTVIAPMKKHNVRFVVVKYLPDDTVVPAAPAASAPPPRATPATPPPPVPAAPPKPACGMIQQPDGTVKMVRCH